MTLLRFLLLLLCSVSFSGLYAQMIQGADTLVGNEWIRYGKPYYKFTIDKDGVYRIPYATLQAAGLGPAILGEDIRLYSLGQPVPVFVRTMEALGPNDYIEFYGRKNRGEHDRHLYFHPDTDMLNPEHSLYTDHRPYYLTIEDNTPGVFVQTWPNLITNPPDPQPFYLYTESIHYTSSHNDPYYNVSGGGAVSYSSYMHGEGFAKASEPNSTTQVMTSHRYEGTGEAHLHLRMASTNYGNHTWQVTWNNQPIDTLRPLNLKIIDTTYLLPLTDLQDVNQLRLNTLTPQSRHTIVQIDLTYPRIPDFEGANERLFHFGELAASPYLIIDNFDHQGTPPLLYTTDGRTRMITSINDLDQVVFRFPAPFLDQKIYLIDPGQRIHTINEMQQYVFEDWSGDDTEYIIITHPELMASGTSSAYVQYRSSPEGGSYKAKAYSVLDLYELFGYGIEKHPQAIRNFVDYFDRHWPSAKMIFIIGRGIEYNRSRISDGTWDPYFFVPTFGRPGADNLLAATLWDLVPRFPIGRLAAVNSQAISDYLAKVRQHDAAWQSGQTLEDKMWMHNVIHAGGGKTANEQDGFKNTMASLADELIHSGFGANVTYFQKESTDNVDQSEFTQMLKLLQQGCSILNYLGHSSTSTFEFSIHDPSEWNNPGRYPVFSAMGCSAGQIHSTTFSLSDKYVQIPQEGAIAFLSGSGGQFPNALVSWARPWYRYFGELAYGSTLGESNVHGLRNVSYQVTPSRADMNSYRFLLEQHTFHGDPAIRLHPFPGPDYTIDRSSIVISPQTIDTRVDSIDLSFAVVNIGRNEPRPVDYTISLQWPDGMTQDIYSGIVLHQRVTEVVNEKIPLPINGQAGIYRLLIHIDPDNVVAELPLPAAESNNTLVDQLGIEGISLYVVSNAYKAVYPPEFSIVTEEQVSLYATSTQVFSAPQTVVMEIDTHALFDSPVKRREVREGHYGILHWQPEHDLLPGQVYYWRIGTDSISPERGYTWSSSSLLFQPGGRRGWNQSHFHQLTANIPSTLYPDSLEYDFEFGRDFINFNNTNRVQNNDLAVSPAMIVDGIIRTAFYTGFANQDVHLFVTPIDPVTGDYIRNPNPGLYGSVNHLSFDAPTYPFSTSTAESRQNLINFIRDIIPDGHYVFVHSYQRPGRLDYFPEQWAGDEAQFGQSIFSILEEQDPNITLRSLSQTGSRPFILIFQKGEGLIREEIAATPDGTVVVNFDSPVYRTSGVMQSVLAGPASAWYTIENEMQPASDSADFGLSAFALSRDLSDTLWIAQDTREDIIDIAFIDAAIYPYVRLIMMSSDTVTRQPVHIDYWRVYYEGLPELAINPARGLEFYNDTLVQGEHLWFKSYVDNISPYPVDDLSVRYLISDQANQTHSYTQAIPVVPAGSFAPIEFTTPTLTFFGDYRLAVEVNPDRSPQEVDYDNNFAVLPFYVIGDKINPVLDVMFDGVRIQDGAMVAVRPEIRIRLTDDNSFLRLTDTSHFVLSLRAPSAFISQRIWFTDPRITFIPATPTGTNTAEVVLRPELLEEGMYELTVRAKDASGNTSGIHDYVRSFYAIQTGAISHFYNLPNPFSGSTRFMYTLSGSGAPDFLSLQIVTLNGILIREITKEELGPIPVGTHQTLFEWDGTDQKGTHLPSGLYLYRLTARDSQGNDFLHWPLQGDGAFSRHGWGKLVIIR